MARFDSRSPRISRESRRGRPFRRLFAFWHVLRTYLQFQDGALKGLIRDIRRAFEVLFTEGVTGLAARLRLGTYARFIPETIGARPWLDSLSECDAGHLHQRCQQPLRFSLIVDAREAQVSHVQSCVESVFAQYWDAWEVVLIVSRDQQDETAFLSEDDRIEVVVDNGPMSLAEVWNTGIARTSGEWIGQLPINSRLTPDALTWLLVSCHRWPDMQCLYSDSVSLNSSGRCVASQCKPDFSTTYLLSSHFTGNLAVFSRSGLNRLGGLCHEFGSAARYDLELRLVETFGDRAVRHLDRVICLDTEPALDGDAVAGASERAAVQAFLDRRDHPGTVEPCPRAAGVNRIVLMPRALPQVTIYIATRNASDLVRNCVLSIREKTDYPNYDIVIINNGSDEEDLLVWLQQESSAGRLTVFDYDRPFNHSEMHNLPIADSKSEFVVLVNNDIEITSPDWLEQLVGTAQLDDSIGSVGALLLYPDQTVQHAGILAGYRGIAGHFHRMLSAEQRGYNGRLHCLQELTACTAALLLVRRSAFMDVGGFDTDNLPTSFNDVDLGLKLRRAGYRCVYNPAVQAIHFESKSRRIDRVREQVYHRHMLATWESELSSDAFHNRNLSLISDSFGMFRHNPPDVDALLAKLAGEESAESRSAA